MTDEEHYLDLMASAALQGILAYSANERISVEQIASISYNFAEEMWAERERRRKARATLNGEKA
jgi:hypothetical protein